MKHRLTILLFILGGFLLLVLMSAFEQPKPRTKAVATAPAQPVSIEVSIDGVVTWFKVPAGTIEVVITDGKVLKVGSQEIAENLEK